MYQHNLAYSSLDDSNDSKTERSISLKRTPESQGNKVDFQSVKNGFMSILHFSRPLNILQYNQPPGGNSIFKSSTFVK